MSKKRCGSFVSAWNNEPPTYDSTTLRTAAIAPCAANAPLPAARCPASSFLIVKRADKRGCSKRLLKLVIRVSTELQDSMSWMSQRAFTRHCKMSWYKLLSKIPVCEHRDNSRWNNVRILAVVMSSLDISSCSTSDARRRRVSHAASGGESANIIHSHG